MNKIGLALSGGGFRASLYHLGLIRFLRDAGTLSQVTHVTAVSGGSVFAAHLVLNWDRYTGSPSEFNAAANELLSFVRLDVRNRIVRRFPLAFPIRLPRRLLGLSNRKLTRTGLLEHHYERYLYGDTSLFRLPERPQLHLLATNVSEGCLCSFNRNGMIMVRRGLGEGIRLDRIRMGLATVPMAVAASSAFPGFFPPLELSGTDVGAISGEFDRQAYTDGGVFDNLGVRMYRLLERMLLSESKLSNDDFIDLPAVVGALRQAGKSGAQTALGRLAQLLTFGDRHLETQQLAFSSMAAGGGGAVSDLKLLQKASHPDSPLLEDEIGQQDGDWLLTRLTEVLHHYQLDRDPLLGTLKPTDPEAALTLSASRFDRQSLAEEDQVWLNRHLFDAAVREATGSACFRRMNSGLDGVLVSDVGKPFEVQAARHAGGLVKTAMRANDILMDRVWQLEMETFVDTPGFVFAPVTDVVDPGQDPTVLHPEVQRQTACIRTDFDRFSDLEISCLVRHGYCVGRKACRTRPDLFGSDVPSGPPWDPNDATDRASISTGVNRGRGRRTEQESATLGARNLQKSAIRRIWSTLLDWRDWTSYIYVPLLVPILVLTPYSAATYYHRTNKMNQLVNSISQGRPELAEMRRLLDHGPEERWIGVAPEEVSELGDPNLQGFEIIQDSWITDLRLWKAGQLNRSDSESRVHHYRRLLVSKKPEIVDQSALRWTLMARDPGARFRFPPQRLEPRLRKSPTVEDPVDGQRVCNWEASFDFRRVPVGEDVDLLIEYQSAGVFLQQRGNSVSVPLNVRTEIAELTVWILLPEGKEYSNFRVIRFETGKPEMSESVKPVTQYMAADSSILAFKLLSLDGGYDYEVSWTYK